MEIRYKEEIKQAKEYYARVIAEANIHGNREIAHRRLCYILDLPYDQFKPFEGSDIKKNIGFNKAMEILEQKIAHFKIQEEEKPQLHCGACQIPIKNTTEFESHIKTKEHLQNAIKVVDKIMSDPHNNPKLKKWVLQAKAGEPHIFSIADVWLELKLKSQLQLLKLQLDKTQT